MDGVLWVRWPRFLGSALPEGQGRGRCLTWRNGCARVIEAPSSLGTVPESPPGPVDIQVHVFSDLGPSPESSGQGWAGSQRQRRSCYWDLFSIVETKGARCNSLYRYLEHPRILCCLKHPLKVMGVNGEPAPQGAGIPRISSAGRLSSMTAVVYSPVHAAARFNGAKSSRCGSPSYRHQRQS